MPKQPDKFFVFVGSPAFCYRERNGKLKGRMVETRLDTMFIADSYGEALVDAVKHARERYEALYKEMYEECFIGSIKVYAKCIARLTPEGEYQGGITGLGAFFEWKIDFPADLDSYVKVFLSKPESKLHPEG